MVLIARMGDECIMKIPKSLLPSPKKIAKRKLHEAIWGGPKRDYGKRIKKGKI